MNKKIVLFFLSFFVLGCANQSSLNDKSIEADVNVENMWAYIGTYSPNGLGIYLSKVNNVTGVLSDPVLVAEVENAGQLAIKNNEFLYVASEVSINNNGYIYSYSIESDGSLTKLGKVESIGAGPAYITLNPSGEYLFVANYFGGSFTVFPIEKDGNLGVATFAMKSEGPLGSSYPKGAVKGSFAISGHDAPHAHMIQSDLKGEYVYGTDLGLDRIYQWSFNELTGKLESLSPPYIKSSSDGSGPRHFVIHPKNNHMYVINEESSTLTSYSMDQGILDEKKTLSSLPDYYVGTSFASGILLSLDAKYIYILNRLHNSISQFSVDMNGDFKLVDNVWVHGDYPRTIILSPDGKSMYVLNQRSDNITQFDVLSKTGKLVFTTNVTPIGSPSQMVLAF